MKNPRAILMIGISIIIGIGAVILASRWVSGKATGDSAQVVVASSDLDLGARLTADKIKLANWPKDSLPQGTFTDLKDLDGRVTKTNIMRGEPVLEAKLAPIGSKAGLSAVIGEGKRAMTVRVNDVIGVAGFALPGNYVDILVNTEDEQSKGGDGKSRSISKIVMEHILVLAVAQEHGRDDAKPKVVNAVTLEVTPEQAEKLDLARSVGTLSLVLRNQVDTKGLATRGATKPNMLNSPAIAGGATGAADEKRSVAPTGPGKPSGRQVEMIRGLQRSSEGY